MFFSLFVRAGGTGGRLRVQQLGTPFGRWIWTRPCHSRAPERMTVVRQSLRWPHWVSQTLVRELPTWSRCRRFSRRNGTERRASASSQSDVQTWNYVPPLHFHYGRPAFVTSVTSLQITMFVALFPPTAVVSNYNTIMTVSSSDHADLFGRSQNFRWKAPSSIPDSTRKIKTEKTIAAIVIVPVHSKTASMEEQRPLIGE